jgi:REP element-mobilizing transposase RayT
MTVCTQNQMCLFGDVVEREIRLNDAGRLVQIVWDGLPEHYPHVSLDHWVIMPNHVHGIVSLAGAGFKPAPMTTATNRPIPRKARSITLIPPPRRLTYDRS